MLPGDLRELWNEEVHRYGATIVLKKALPLQRGTMDFPETDCMNGTRGFLIDLDGVLYVGNRAVDGAAEAVRFLIDNGYPFRCVSNTTRKSRHTIAGHLSALGFRIPENHIFTPPLAAVAHMKKTGKTNYYLLSTGDVNRDFAETGPTDPHAGPDWVIIGDAGDKVTYDTMNTAFRHLMDGAELIALENDRYWMAAEGLSLSAGPIVKALEYATGKTALVMGKPSPAFFSLALQDMHLGPEQAAMIGDDIITDIGGAHRAGMKGILVRTGKFRQGSLDTAAIKPTCIIDSFSRIKDLLESRK
jgi:HAD superfamily hydrolase (TIGR01458 family)